MGTVDGELTAGGIALALSQVVGAAVDRCKQAGWLCDKTEGSEWHHIVAENSKNIDAIGSRLILENSDIGINSEANMVEIPYRVHRRLHTRVYYQTIHAILLGVFRPRLSPELNKAPVTAAMGGIKGTIEAGLFPA